VTRPSRLVLAWFASLLLGSTFALVVDAQTTAAPAVAQVLGNTVQCAQFGSTDARECARSLFVHVRMRVEQDYLERRGLTATAEEYAELEAYNLAFEVHDRDQRARKLAELDERLLQPRLDAAQRQRLLNFRDVLVRLARFDADVDAGVAQRAAMPPEMLRRVIERAKLEVALYAEFGGIVGVASFGPYAHGARIALIEDHLARGTITLLDAEVAEYFHALLHAAPVIADRAATPDFTPFWLRPIPASYVAP